MICLPCQAFTLTPPQLRYPRVENTSAKDTPPQSRLQLPQPQNRKHLPPINFATSNTLGGLLPATEFLSFVLTTFSSRPLGRITDDRVWIYPLLPDWVYEICGDTKTFDGVRAIK